MRVLHVAACYPPTWAYGGIPRVAHGLARALRRAGVDARVWTTDAFAADARAPVGREHVLDGVPVTVSPNLSNRLAWAHQLYLPTRPPPDLAGFDLVHLHGHRHLLNLWAWRRAKAAGKPVVLTGNGTVPRIERKQGVKAIWDALADGEVPRAADAVVAVSRAEVGQLLAYGVRPERIRRIPNGLWLEEFDALPARGAFRARHALGEGPIVAYLGQISPRKGVDRLAAAFADGALAPATLVVAGPIRGARLPAGVRHVGVLEGPDRLSLLVDADVLAYPSTDEIFGLVPLEGLLCGAPVVVGGDCGCGEIVAEAGAGALVDGTVPALRDALRRLLADRAAAAEMVERGRRWIRANADFERIAARHVALYAELLA